MHTCVMNILKKYTHRFIEYVAEKAASLNLHAYDDLEKKREAECSIGVFMFIHVYKKLRCTIPKRFIY